MVQNYRLFVEKKPKFNVESRLLQVDLKQHLNLPGLTGVRVIVTYDLFNLTCNDFEAAKYVVFAEKNTDNLYEMINLSDKHYIAYTYIPGQYDQRADSALQCLHLLSSNELMDVTTGILIILEGNLSHDEVDKVKKYLINPIEMMEKDLGLLIQSKHHPQAQKVLSYDTFNQLDSDGLASFLSFHQLAMSVNDIQLIQDYFKNQEKRAPTETEIKVLDTYWSDHCRHTTFETIIDDVSIEPGHYQSLFHSAYGRYQEMRQEVYGEKSKPMTLMDMATINAKYLHKKGWLHDVERTDEINACSVCVDIEIDGKKEPWSLQFKNETHNHPTEIEPYGGASTCVGGAIRDPLSGRSYVYQAVRISGSGDPRQKIEDTLPGKLPQKVITTKAAHGFSSYGNQIGLATTLVNEIYHPGYIAKRMEVGMVVGAAPHSNIRREKPIVSDQIILLGGGTGRDGCGGATGSSKIHTEKSTVTSSAEVQKGNPIIERKIQRLFRNPNVTHLIKKCNDFGAGGVSVAIGELARGLHIYLERIPVKYAGLTPTELAISESQERMAVIISKDDVEQFIKYAEEENLRATVVAEVINEERLIMTYDDVVVVDLARQFLDTNGAKNHVKVFIKDPGKPISSNEPLDYIQKWQENLSNLNVASQRGLSETFDATIGATTVLMPFGGKHKLTPSQASVQKFPVLNGFTDHASIVTFGYDPYLSSWSPFHGALFAVVDSVSKVIATGGDLAQIKFSFQEYFEKLGNIPKKWGKPFAALLGALYAQDQLGLAAIGGKDSMSGSFYEKHVPPTLISFAVAPTLASHVISPEFKGTNHYVYLAKVKLDANRVPDFNQLTVLYRTINSKIQEGKIISAMSVGIGGIATTISKMAFGNYVGFHLENLQEELFSAQYGSIVVEATEEIEGCIYLGRTTADPTISFEGSCEKLELDRLIAIWEQPLSTTFKFGHGVDGAVNEDFHQTLARMYGIPMQTSEIKGKALRSCDSQKIGDGAAILRFSKKGTTNNNQRQILVPFVRQSQDHSTVPNFPTITGIQPICRMARPKVVIPVFPGTNCEYDSVRAFREAGGDPEIVLFNNLTPKHSFDSIHNLANQISHSQIFMLPGGFSAGDEPNGSAKFIAAILRHPKVSNEIHQLLERGGLILGICNGFQALIKCGLLPYGRIIDLDDRSPTLTYNTIGRHVSTIVRTKVINNSSPWLCSYPLNDCFEVPISHGEGRLVIDSDYALELFANGQIVTQYVDLNDVPTLDSHFNPNGSSYAIEGLTAYNGQIFGKMGHSERYGNHLYKNIPGVSKQDIFLNGVNYFK